MALDLKYSATLKAAQLNAITSTVGANSVIQIYSGNKPASPDVNITDQLLLATMSCSAVFAPGAVGGTLTVNPLADGTGTVAAGEGTKAAWFRLVTAGGTACVDGTVGISNCDMNLNNPNIATGQTISVASMIVTNPN